MESIGFVEHYAEAEVNGRAFYVYVVNVSRRPVPLSVGPCGQQPEESYMPLCGCLRRYCSLNIRQLFPLSIVRPPVVCSITLGCRWQSLDFAGLLQQDDGTAKPNPGGRVSSQFFG